MADIVFYCINLDSSPERWALCQEEFRAHQLSVHRFSAIRGEEDFHNLPKGHYGCALSHYQVCREFLKTTHEYAVIFEDDILLTADFRDVFSIPLELNRVNSNWGLVLLGRTTNHHNFGGRPTPIIQEYTGRYICITYPLGAFGYLINRNLAYGLLAHSQKKFSFYDVDLPRICAETGYPILALKRSIVYTNIWLDDSTTEGISTIQTHLRCNMSLFTRDYELDIIQRTSPGISKKVHSIKDWPQEKWPQWVKHLFIGRPENDLPDEELLARAILYIEGGRWGKWVSSPDILDPIRTSDFTFISRITSGTDLDRVGLYLDACQYAPFKLYITRDLIPRLTDLPIYPNVEIHFCDPTLTRDEMIRSGKGYFVWIEMYKYTIFSRYCFRELSNSTQVWEGHRVDDIYRKNYLLTGYVEDYIPPVSTPDISPSSVDFINMWPGFTPGQLPYLGPTGNDILVSSVFGNDDRPAQRKVLIVGETNRPLLHDRYDLIIKTDLPCRLNEVWIPFLAWSGIDLINLERTRHQASQQAKTRFCSFVVGNSGPVFRREFLRELSKYRKVDSAGPVDNNTGFMVTGDHRSKSLVDYYSEGQFVLCCENTIAPGYITEKIGLAFAAGCVPIYWGDSKILELFNPKSFIYLNRYSSISQAISAILDADWSSMIQEPLFPNGLPEVLHSHYFQKQVWGSKSVDFN